MQRTERRYDRRTFLQLAGATAAITACDSVAPPSAAPSNVAPVTAVATKAPVAEALFAYSALEGPATDGLLKAFNSAHPNVKVILLPLAAAGELRTRIEVEKASPKGDVFIGGSSEFHDALGREGLLEPYIPPIARDIDPKFKDPSGYWVGWYVDVLGFVSNTERLAKELGGKTPATWDDLLEAPWKGKLILPDPMKTSEGYVFIATQIFRFGRNEARAMDYLKMLDGHIADYTPTAAGALALIGEGQSVGCPGWARDILIEKGRNKQIDLSVPSETGFDVGAVSIIKGTKSAGAAKAFVDWCLTNQAGELNVKLSERSSVRTDVAPPPGAPNLSGVTLVAYDRQWATDNKDRILKLWRAAVGA